MGFAVSTLLFKRSERLNGGVFSTGHLKSGRGLASGVGLVGMGSTLVGIECGVGVFTGITSSSGVD